MTELDKTQPVHRSHLFTVRLWVEELGNEQVEWRGQVQHVLSGETRYFREWATLVALLDATLSSLESNESSSEFHAK